MGAQEAVVGRRLYALGLRRLGGIGVAKLPRAVVCSQRIARGTVWGAGAYVSLSGRRASAAAKSTVRFDHPRLRLRLGYGEARVTVRVWVVG